MKKVQIISTKLIKQVCLEAGKSSRKRSIVNFHQPQDKVQRMLNAVDPESYCPPHKHKRPDKTEVFLVLRGRGALVFFNNQGKISQYEIIDPKGPIIGVDIPPGFWHMPISLEKGTVFYEVIEGPYNPKTHKKFAPWAPSEEEKEKGKKFLLNIKNKIT